MAKHQQQQHEEVAAPEQHDQPANGGTHDQLREMLTEAEVLAITKLSRTSLHRLTRANRFPQGVYVAPNTKRFFRDQIVAWQNALDEHDHFNPARGRGKGRRRASA